jgi:phytoene dehydrogenase-like protein
LYFAAERPPVDEPILVLNGEGRGLVNNLCVPNLVAPTYAPPGAALISATVLGIPAIDDHQLESSVRQELQEWFGNQVQTWRHLRTYRIPFALPVQTPPALSPVAKSTKRREGLWICGDYLDTASIQGAMVSGRRTADDVLRRL